MKQILQNILSGETFLESLPTPKISKNSVLIQTSCSLVSLGTERMLVEFGKSNLIEKARQQPEKIKQVLDKIRTDGFLPTMEAVFSKLGQPIPLGYCNVGKIVGIGSGVTNFSVGDRVSSNGPHAEIISVPQNLVAKIPDSVTDEEASFTVISSIGLQGIRLLSPTIGETFIVYGLGLIGLITCQLLKANGCKVIGIDINESKFELAKSWGVICLNPNKSDLHKSILNYTNQIGVDGVIITASAKNDDIVSNSAKMCRKKARIILVGVVNLNLNRTDLYEKELSFQVSCSYGPGRYDNEYEQEGFDYPLAYVRWTENRNFQTILELLKTKSLNVKSLITKRADLKDFNQIYSNMDQSNCIAALLIYQNRLNQDFKNQTLFLGDKIPYKQKRVIGIIGAGNFTNRTLLPILNKTKTKVKYISSKGGLSGTQLAKKYGIEIVTTDYKQILNDETVDTIMIATPHNLHAELAIKSIEAGKHTFIEKPLALNSRELEKIRIALNNNPDIQILVGFNRRFSPHLIKIKQSLGDNFGVLNIIATMNAGFISKNHWTQDIKKGGGRIIGEACHLLDVCVYLTGSLIKSVCMTALGNSADSSTDNASLLLKFENGSNGVINYFSNGSKQYGKERVEVHSQERTWVLDNYIKTIGFDVKGFKTFKTKQNKGHYEQFNNFLKQSQNAEPLISKKEIFNVTKASFAAIESIKEKKWIDIK